jgi:hypothetical protein
VEPTTFRTDARYGADKVKYTNLNANPNVRVLAAQHDTTVLNANHDSHAVVFQATPHKAFRDAKGGPFAQTTYQSQAVQPPQEGTS